MTNNEVFESLELINAGQAEFKNPFEHRFERQPYLIYYIFLSIEIQSVFPPTDCIFTMNFCTRQSGILKTIIVHSMEYRKAFLFENGFYVLYIDEVKEFKDVVPLDVIPLNFSFTNNRDDNSLARLFYKVTKDAQGN